MNQESALKRFCICANWHISECGGGAEVQACYLAEELVRLGYTVDYICFTREEKLAGKTTDYNGVNVHWLPYERGFLGIKWLFLQQRLFFKALSDVHPDIIVLRLSPPFTYAIGKYAREANIPFVWICTGDVSCTKNIARAKSKLYPPTPKKLFSYFYGYISDFLRNLGMKDVTLAFTQNDYQARLVKDNFGYDSCRMVSGHIPPLHFLNPSDRLKMQRVLWCANLGTHKRPELFIELAQKMNSCDSAFVMVGGHSDTQYTEKLFKDKSNNLCWTGQKSFEESLTYFDDATVFVNTSTPEGDGFPNTFVQAWLRGVPVLSLGINPNNVLLEEKLGFVCKDINEMSDIIQTLFDDEKLYADYSHRCHDYALKHHSVSAACNNFLECLEERGIIELHKPR